MSFWDDKEMFPSGDYVQFENVGDTVTGRITAMTKKMWDDGKVDPQIELDTAEGPKTLTAGPVRLKAALAEKRPGIGDRIKITFIGIEKRPMGKTLKLFDVEVAAPAASAPRATLAEQIKADKAGQAARAALAPVLADGEIPF